jgi:hypothetical protein
VESLTSQITKLLNDGEWDAAQKKFDELDKHHGSQVAPEQLQDLRTQIGNVRTLHQARVQSGPYTFVAPKSEAERFYRRGVLAYYDGRVDEAQTVWTGLTQAFKDVPSEAAWVRLAEEALKEKAEVTNLTDMIKALGNENANDGMERLRALKQLYSALPDSPLKRQALEKIEGALAGK